jgi:hypothetical protein
MIFKAVNRSVGIGNIDPTYKLDVTGDINYTGDLRESGTVVISGGVYQGVISTT